MKPLVVANWKMNPETLKDAKALFDSVENGLKEIKDVEVVVCPPFVYFYSAILGERGFFLGAQNCFWEKKGAFTGEASAAMLKNLGCEYIIVGHSERRKYFGETDETVNKKIKAVLNENITPILCVGETQEERDRGKAEGPDKGRAEGPDEGGTEAVLKRQITAALKEITAGELSKLVLAYEPVWAIGTGNSCEPGEARKMNLFIRTVFSDICGSDVSEQIKILYGGSVNGKNSKAYIKEAGFNGLLVGGASLVAEEFIKIVKSAA